VFQSPAPASALAYTHARSASKIRAVGVVILARNQSEEIARCIASVFAAHSHSGWRNSLWIVVVADSCIDDTAKAARNSLGAFGQVLEIGAHSRPAAYQLGVAIVMEHFRAVPRHTLLLTSTDAAAELPRNWIEAQLQCSKSPMGLSSTQS
jgi:hypothetical protein